MHVELSLDATENNQASNNAQERIESSRPDGTQTISGSQVACAFGRFEEKKQKDQGKVQLFAIAMSAVFSVVALYLIFALLL